MSVMTQLLTVHDAAVRYVQARQARDAAKAALREYRKRVGGCQRVNPRDDMCYREEPTMFPFKDWCPTCQGSQPLWKAYREAATEVGVALRAIQRVATQHTEETK